jgi:Spx/MgsR family transcriptional regulator
MKGLGIEHRFIDYRHELIDEKTLSSWLMEVGWTTLLNRKSATWRNLSTYKKKNLHSDSAKVLMLEFPTLIKRPVIETEGPLLVGFKEEQKAQLTARQSTINKL